jgi:hypothetical protein
LFGGTPGRTGGTAGRLGRHAARPVHTATDPSAAGPCGEAAEARDASRVVIRGQAVNPRRTRGGGVEDVEPTVTQAGNAAGSRPPRPTGRHRCAGGGCRQSDSPGNSRSRTPIAIRRQRPGRDASRAVTRSRPPAVSAAHGDGRALTAAQPTNARACTVRLHSPAKTPVSARCDGGNDVEPDVVLRAVLYHYAEDSPYVRLDEWDGTACSSCGDRVASGDTYHCDRCGEDVCDGRSRRGRPAGGVAGPSRDGGRRVLGPAGAAQLPPLPGLGRGRPSRRPRGRRRQARPHVCGGALAGGADPRRAGEELRRRARPARPDATGGHRPRGGHRARRTARGRRVRRSAGTPPQA